MTEFGIETHVSAPRRRAPFDIFASADPRTLEILRRRHTARHPRRRGWLVRRALVVADLAGLAAAMVTVELIFGQGSGSREPGPPFAGGACPPRDASRLDRDRAFLPPLRPGRGAHASPDDRRPRRRLPPRHGLHLALLRRRSRSPAWPIPSSARCSRSGSWRSASSPSRAHCARAWCRRSITLRAEHDHRRRRRRRPERRAQADPPLRVRHQRRRLRGRRAEGAAERARARPAARLARGAARDGASCSTSSAW